MTAASDPNIKAVPDDWQISTLNDVLNQRSDIIQPTPQLREKFVGLEHIESGESRLKRYDPNADLKSAKSRFFRGDILYGKLRPYLDKAVVSGIEGICSTDLLVLTPQPEISTADYLINILHTHEFIEYAISTTSGTNHPRTSWKSISEFEFPLPPLPEQRRIAAILSTADDALQRSRQAALETERLKAGVMQELMTRGIGHTEFREDPDVGMIPKVWNVSTIGDVSEKFLNGGTPSTKNPAFWEGTIQWTTSSILTSFYLDRGECAISKEGLEKSASNLIPKGNVLVATRVGIGKVAVNRIDIAINQDLTGIILDKSKIMPEFFVWLLLSDKYNRKLKGMSRGTTIKGLIRDELERIPLPIPYPAEQQKIATILSTIDRKLSLQRQRTAYYEKIRQGLMNDLLTGRKRVKVT